MLYFSRIIGIHRGVPPSVTRLSLSGPTGLTPSNFRSLLRLPSLKYLRVQEMFIQGDEDLLWEMKDIAKNEIPPGLNVEWRFEECFSRNNVGSAKNCAHFLSQSRAFGKETQSTRQESNLESKEILVLLCTISRAERNVEKPAFKNADGSLWSFFFPQREIHTGEEEI